MFGALLGAGASILGSVLSSRNQKKSADKASSAQIAMSEKAIAEQKRQFDAMRALQQPYVDAGRNALGGYQDLLGMNGVMAQQTAVNNIEQSPFFKSQYGQAENAILQNASATGGLRGGNIQEALADNRSNMLYQNVLKQQQNLGGLMSIGQNASAGVGNASISTGNNIASQLNGIGQAQAGNYLAQGQAKNNMYSGIANTLGATIGAGLGGLF